MQIPFTKMNSQGNDFVVIDNTNLLYQFNNKKIRSICSRDIIGCDQLLLLNIKDSNNVICEIFNQDGSSAQQCGNGMRAIMLFLNRKYNFFDSKIFMNSVPYDVSFVNEKEIKGYLLKMKGEVESLSITGIFSKTLPNQELKVAEWAKNVLGTGIKISCSHQVGGLGLLERENASILNASLKGVATKMVTAFKETIKKLGLNSQLFIGQNDGTLMSLEQVQEFPVLTISSGPTNSIRGAGALSKISNGIVIDVGGTTSDGGVLVNYFPRESTQSAQIGGVRTNFRMPDVVAVGIGGGTTIRIQKEHCQLGPDSVGYQLKEKGIAFGGNVLTISDVFIAEEQLHITGASRSEILKKEISKVMNLPYERILQKVKETIQIAIEKLVDTLKTDGKDIPVIACGGGAFLLPQKIAGASKVVFPEHMEVANAFGACIAQISSEEEIVINTIQKNEKNELKNLLEKVTTNLLQKGALASSIDVLMKESTPLAYLPGAVKLKVKLCGDFIS